MLIMDPWLSGSSNNATVSQMSHSQPGFDDNFKPFLRMNDSSSYISTLETKLERIRGNDKQLTGRSMIEDAESRKDDHMSSFLQDIHGSWSAWNDENSESASANETHLQTMLKLKFRPEKCALSSEELQNLLQADQLNLFNQNLQQNSDQIIGLSFLDDVKPASKDPV